MHNVHNGSLSRPDSAIKPKQPKPLNASQVQIRQKYQLVEAQVAILTKEHLRGTTFGIHTLEPWCVCVWDLGGPNAPAHAHAHMQTRTRTRARTHTRKHTHTHTRTHTRTHTHADAQQTLSTANYKRRADKNTPRGGTYVVGIWGGWDNYYT